MATVRASGGAKMVPWILVIAAVTVLCCAVIANLRAGTSALERRAALRDREVAHSQQVIRSLEREVASLTAPSTVYAQAATALGMERVQMAGVIRVNGRADKSVMSASLPGSMVQLLR